MLPAFPALPCRYTEPAPLYLGDKWGYDCMFKMTREATPTDCTTLARIFPPVSNHTRVGPFIPWKGFRNYTSFNFSTDRVKLDLGTVDSPWCNKTIIVSDEQSTIGMWAQSGFYWYCGGMRMTVRIPRGSMGSCAWVRLAARMSLIDHGMRTRFQMTGEASRRRRRATFDVQAGSPTYIYAIGVPQECLIITSWLIK